MTYDLVVDHLYFLPHPQSIQSKQDVGCYLLERARTWVKHMCPPCLCYHRSQGYQIRAPYARSAGFSSDIGGPYRSLLVVEVVRWHQQPKIRLATAQSSALYLGLTEPSEKIETPIPCQDIKLDKSNPAVITSAMALDLAEEQQADYPP